MNSDAKDVRVTVRVDKNLKNNAEYLFDRLGLNMTTAFNIFLRKAVEENAIPFSVSTKSTGFAYGYSPDDITRAFSDAVYNETNQHFELGYPVARYDTHKQRAYLENTDGSREYFDEE